jgi:hypothetical protein
VFSLRHGPVQLPILQDTGRQGSHYRVRKIDCSERRYASPPTSLPPTSRTSHHQYHGPVIWPVCYVNFLTMARRR